MPVSRISRFRPHLRRLTGVRIRARFQGIAEFICPVCGYFNSFYVRRLSWKVQCREETCRTIYGIGLQLWRIRHGRGTGSVALPPDKIIPNAPSPAPDPVPAETFPEWPPLPVEAWREGIGMNTLWELEIASQDLPEGNSTDATSDLPDPPDPSHL